MIRWAEGGRASTVANRMDRAIVPLYDRQVLLLSVVSINLEHSGMHGVYDTLNKRIVYYVEVLDGAHLLAVPRPFICFRSRRKDLRSRL